MEKGSEKPPAYGAIAIGDGDKVDLKTQHGDRLTERQDGEPGEDRCSLNTIRSPVQLRNPGGRLNYCHWFQSVRSANWTSFEKFYGFSFYSVALIIWPRARREEQLIRNSEMDDTRLSF